MDGTQKPQQEIAAASATESATFLAIIAKAAADPNTDIQKMQALLDMKERIDKSHAEQAFNQALARISAKLPHVKKNGTIELPKKDGTTGIVAFAMLEHIDTAIRPLLVEEGLSLSFDTAPRAGDGGGLIITGTLSHAVGHSRTSSMPLPLDSGPGRNNLQANGSTMKYGQRYVTCMLLNIITENEDDDGQGADEKISLEQAVAIDVKIAEVAANKPKFLKYMGVDDVRNIRAKDHAKAMTALKDKETENAKKKAAKPAGTAEAR